MLHLKHMQSVALTLIELLIFFIVRENNECFLIDNEFFMEFTRLFFISYAWFVKTSKL